MAPWRLQAKKVCACRMHPCRRSSCFPSNCLVFPSPVLIAHDPFYCLVFQPRPPSRLHTTFLSAQLASYFCTPRFPLYHQHLHKFASHYTTFFHCFAFAHGNMAETDSAIKKARKRTARELDKALASPMRIQWGSYSTQFPLPPSANDDTYNFLQAIEKKSTYAVVGANVNADLMEHLRRLSKIEILDYYHTSPGGPSQQLFRPDVILVDSANDLKDRLGTEFRTPLLFRASKEHPNTLPTDGFGFKSFISSFVNQDQARVDVNDWTIQDEEDRTYKTTVAEMVTRLVAEADDGKDQPEPDQPEPVVLPLNFLDIQNRTGIQFRPWPIALQDLNNRIASRQQNSALMWVGKSFASQPHSHQEFFIASTRNCITPTHVDTGGANTWVAVLEGRKIWFFPRSSLVDHAAAVQWLGVAGSLEPESLDAAGWAKVELRAGDIL